MQHRILMLKTKITEQTNLYLTIRKIDILKLRMRWLRLVGRYIVYHFKTNAVSWNNCKQVVIVD